MPPVDYDPTEPFPGQPAPPPSEQWVAKLTLNLTRVQVSVGPQGPQSRQVGAIAQEEIGEGVTPGEAFRAAREKMKPVMKAYKLESGPIPVEVIER